MASGALLDFVAGARTITRDVGDFVAEGFAAGQTITLANAGANNGQFLVSGVTTTVLTLDATAPALSNANDVASVIVTAPNAGAAMVARFNQVFVRTSAAYSGSM